jgi:MerR family transcriptional regulator, redox-sensitive transcriptional activator SoxR
MTITIGELADRTGLAASAIRYYEELGLLPRPVRVSGRRVFDDASSDRLMVITFAKEAGFSLREIRRLLEGFDRDTPAGVRWQKLATAKLEELEVAAARINAMKQLLREALRCGCIELDACGKLFRRARRGKKTGG